MTAPLPFRSAAFTTAAPRLSVLVPFYRESPLALLEALRCRDPHEVEVIVLDDGSAMPEITAEVGAFIAATQLAVSLLTLEGNEGRARGRNRLTAAARGRHFLFLDSDMLPDGQDFLDRWLAEARSDAAVVFGGFSLCQAPRRAEFAVHRLMAAKGDCLDAATRALTPEKYVFTSNLLVRRDVFESEGFDPAFTGWGWEDTEWGLRVAAKYGVGHIDNAATHMGLDTAATLARKYEQSAANFARVIARHREAITAYPSYRAARLIRRLPLRGLLRPALKAAALTSVLPARLRALTLRVYRAALYAEVV